MTRSFAVTVSTVSLWRASNRMNRSNVVGVIFVLVNAGILSLAGPEVWRQSFTVQGLILGALGAVVLALPDIPQFRRLSTPSKLRSAWRRLQLEGEIRDHHVGFDEMVDIIDERTSRITDPDRLDLIRTGHEPYGNPTIIAGFVDESEPSHHQLTEWTTLTLWVNDVRAQIRFYGVVLFFAGFVLQILGVWFT